MSMTKTSIRELVEWWFSRDASTAMPPLRDDFVFVWNRISMDLDNVLGLRAITATVERLQLHGTVAGDGSAAALFDAFDPITGLLQRSAWFIEEREGRIARVVEVRQDLPPDEPPSTPRVGGGAASAPKGNGMSVAEPRVGELVEWWFVRDASAPTPARFSARFEYVWGALSLGLDDVLDIRAATVPKERLLLHSVVAGESDAAALFDALDPVTGMTHRYAWFIEYRDDCIARLVAVSQYLPPE